MTNQEKKDLKYLRDAVLNGTTGVEGCLTEARKFLKTMEIAINAYSEGRKGGETDGKERCP
ncbi:MAG: hypothetical protein DRN30_03580 [Thermoplasmata archaeon]|nr:MAG: hypothetical protein DRN30_03580 [Thermoplasmata archaeon]